MTKAFGNKFIANFGERDTGIWFETLKHLTQADLAYGFKKALLITSDEEWEKQAAWPPNVKEFRMYCEKRFEDFGLPNSHNAFAEAKTNSYLTNPKWSHPIVSIAANQLNKKDYLDDNDYKQFAETYQDLCQRFMNGEAMSIPNHYIAKHG